MVQVQCTNCNALLEIPDQYRGATGKCKHCGGIILVPEEDAKPVHRPNNIKPDLSLGKRHIAELLIVMAVLLTILAGLSIWRGSDGSPLGLAVFALNLLAGVAFGAAFCVELHTPDILSGWFNMPLSRARAALIFIPSSLLAFFCAYMTYSP